MPKAIRQNPARLRKPHNGVKKATSFGVSDAERIISIANTIADDTILSNPIVKTAIILPNRSESGNMGLFPDGRIGRGSDDSINFFSQKYFIY